MPSTMLVAAIYNLSGHALFLMSDNVISFLAHIPAASLGLSPGLKRPIVMLDSITITLSPFRKLIALFFFSLGIFMDIKSMGMMNVE